MSEHRLQLVSVTLSSSDAASGVSVVVDAGESPVVGAAAGLGTSIASTAARATLRAVGSMTEHSLAIADTAYARIGDNDVALVSVAVARELVIGTAVVGVRTAAEAFARATLDALNRILSGAADPQRRQRHQIVYRTAP